MKQEKTINFKALIMTNKLTSSEKKMLVIISDYKNFYGIANISNRDLSEKTQTKLGTVKNLISSMVKKGFIKSVITYKGETKEVLERTIILAKKCFEL